MDTAEISNVAAAPDCRRQGIASLLLHTALEGVEAEIFLEVRKSNLPAIALYQKYGFAEYGIPKNYYSSPREDAVLMKRPMT
jgi:ribosomal-protein-alanine N-acetyltransferase